MAKTTPRRGRTKFATPERRNGKEHDADRCVPQMPARQSLELRQMPFDFLPMAMLRLMFSISTSHRRQDSDCRADQVMIVMFHQRAEKDDGAKNARFEPDDDRVRRSEKIEYYR